MKTDLGLSDDQTAQITAMFTKQQKDREAVMAEVTAMRDNGQQLTEEQKARLNLKWMPKEKTRMPS